MLQVDNTGVLVPCPQCQRTNRIPFTHLGQAGRCGICQASLPVLSSPLPINQEAHFETLVSQSRLPVLVDYWAPWCGPCRVVAPEIEKVATAEAGHLVVVKVNTEQLPSLSQRYRIHSIPTLVLFRAGQEVQRIAGARPAAAIRAFVHHTTP